MVNTAVHLPPRPLSPFGRSAGGFDPFLAAEPASPAKGGGKKSVVMWQRAMRKSAAGATPPNL